MKSKINTATANFSDLIRVVLHPHLQFNREHWIYFPASVFLIFLPFSHTWWGAGLSLGGLIGMCIYARSIIMLLLAIGLGWISPFSYVFLLLAFLLVCWRLKTSRGDNLLFFFLIFNSLLWLCFRYYHYSVTTPVELLLMYMLIFIFCWSWLSFINTPNNWLKLIALVRVLMVLGLWCLVNKQMLFIGLGLVLTGLLIPRNFPPVLTTLFLGIVAVSILAVLISPLLKPARSVAVYHLNSQNFVAPSVNSDQEILQRITSFNRLLLKNGFQVKNENALENLSSYQEIYVLGNVSSLSPKHIKNIESWVKVGGSVTFVTDPVTDNLIKLKSYFDNLDLEISVPHEFFAGLIYPENCRENFELINDSPVWISSASSPVYGLIKSSPVERGGRGSVYHDKQLFTNGQVLERTWNKFSNFIFFDYYRGQICIIAYPQMFQSGNLCENFNYISNQLGIYSRHAYYNNYLWTGIFFVLIISVVLAVQKSRKALLVMTVWILIWLCLHPQINFNFSPCFDLNLVEIDQINLRNLVIAELSRNGLLVSVQHNDLIYADNLFYDDLNSVKNLDNFSGQVVVLDDFNLQSRDRLIKFISRCHQ
ncbi:MAG: hypothetical protein ACP5FK_00330 [bacterium]